MTSAKCAWQCKSRACVVLDMEKSGKRLACVVWQRRSIDGLGDSTSFYRRLRGCRRGAMTGRNVES